MRLSSRSRSARITTIALSTLVAGGVLPGTARASGESTLYVDNSNPNCATSSTVPNAGAAAVPYCDIDPAGKAAQPGTTVLVEPSAKQYMGIVNVSSGQPNVPVSGTPGHPITFKAAGPGVAVQGAGCSQGAGFWLVGQHDLVIDGFTLDSYCSTAVVNISDSQNITVTNNTIEEKASANGVGGYTPAGVYLYGVTNGSVTGNKFSMWQDTGAVWLTGGSSGIRVAHNEATGILDGQIMLSNGTDAFVSQGPNNQFVDNTTKGTFNHGVVIDSGGDGDVVAGNFLPCTQITVNAAKSVDVVNNTVYNWTGTLISVTGGAGATVENNIAAIHDQYIPCNSRIIVGQLNGITVDAASTAGTKVDYNNVYIPIGTAYTWADQPYTTASALNAATGQGAHDLIDWPRLTTAGVPGPGSPAIDSADPTAPGKPTADLNGVTPFDDRGALEAATTPTPTPTPDPTPTPTPNPTPGPAPLPGTAGPKVYRDAGADRVGTGIAISQQRWVANGSAKAVVLATSTNYPDALSGGPLAAKKGGPLLLTDGKASSLDSRVLSEIRRVLPHGGAVHVLGGDGAMSPAIVAQLKSLGYAVTQYKGTDRADTALRVARDGMGSPQHVVLATGAGFADALAAGPYAAGPFADAPGAPAAIVLSDGTHLDPATEAFLKGKTVATVGGQAGHAWPGAAKSFSGVDRFDTAARVAREFTGLFAAKQVGIANGVASAANPGYPDALTGGAFMAESNGPIVLVDGIQDTVPADSQRILMSQTGDVRADIFGGPSVVSPRLASSIVALLHGTAQF